MEGKTSVEDKVVIRGRLRTISRVRSAIITQKEISLLRKDEGTSQLEKDEGRSPAAVKGFVRSMTQFYTDLCPVTSDKNNNKIEEHMKLRFPGLKSAREKNFLTHFPNGTSAWFRTEACLVLMNRPTSSYVV